MGKTWNPVRGCSRVSAGCDHCYAIREAHRHYRPDEELTARRKDRIDWTGKVHLVPEKLEEPLHWKKPRRVFVNSMSDLFHESLDFRDIAAVYGVMAHAPQHTFQILTKRPRRRLEFFRWLGTACGTNMNTGQRVEIECLPLQGCEMQAARRGVSFGARLASATPPWPLPHVWEGVSVEDPPTADERIPLLLLTPAAVHFVSYEPALGPVDFGWFISGIGRSVQWCPLDWVIVGGESGPGARPFDLAWARSVIAQCRAAGVKCFVKQLGAAPFEDGAGRGCQREMRLRDRKGGDMQEWPKDLRVREFPESPLREVKRDQEKRA